MKIIKMKWFKLTNKHLMCNFAEFGYVRVSDMKELSNTDGDKKSYFISDNENTSTKYDFLLIRADTEYMCMARVILDNPIITNNQLFSVVSKVFGGSIDNPMRTAVKVCRL